MVLGLFGDRQSRGVRELLARGEYDEAAERLRERIQKGTAGPRARLQLADALVLGGRTAEGATLLRELAEEHAQEGFFAKAIALLGRVEKLEPGRPEVGRRRAELLRRKADRDRARRKPRRPRGLEIGIEEVSEPGPAKPPAAQPAAGTAPLGGDLLSIVEKALKE